MSDPHARRIRAENKRLDKLWRAQLPASKHEQTTIQCVLGTMPVGSATPIASAITENTERGDKQTS